MLEDDNPEKCVVWKTSAKYLGSSGDYVDLWSARAGGEYRVTNSAKMTLTTSSYLTPARRVLLTNWLVRQRHNGTQKPTITSYILEGLYEGPKISISERVDRLLIWLNVNIPGLGRNLPLGSYIQSYSANDSLIELTSLLGAEIGSLDDSETIEILYFASKSGLIEFTPRPGDSGGFVSLTFPGYQRIEYLEKQQPLNEQAFVAMWFGQEMNEAYELGFKSAIEVAGYKPVRIDRMDHNNKIDDEIVAEIRRSRFVVADFTSDVFQRKAANGIEKPEAISRGGVYFEAGFAKGLGREVIWTARNDLIELVHFDTRQFNHITWANPEELRDKLSKRISATLGDGPLKKLK